MTNIKRVKELCKKHQIKVKDQSQLLDFTIIYIEAQEDYIKELLEEKNNAKK